MESVLLISSIILFIISISASKLMTIQIKYLTEKINEIKTHYQILIEFVEAKQKSKKIKDEYNEQDWW